jgi:O-antigen/teichoic acid export membrane protein
VGGAALAHQIVPVLFGDEYNAAIPVLAILIWTVPLMFLSEFLGYVVVISGQESRVARAILISTSVNICLNALLIPTYGYVAAAIMTVITEAVLVGQYCWLLRPLLKQLDCGRMLLLPCVAALLMGASVMVFQNSLLVFNVLFGSLIYMTLLIIFRVVGRDELAFVQQLLQRRSTIAPDTA